MRRKRLPTPDPFSPLFRFIISGQGAVELTYFSQKGGTITQTVELTETPIPTPADKP